MTYKMHGDFTNEIHSRGRNSARVAYPGVQKVWLVSFDCTGSHKILSRESGLYKRVLNRCLCVCMFMFVQSTLLKLLVHEHCDVPDL